MTTLRLYDTGREVTIEDIEREFRESLEAEGMVVSYIESRLEFLNPGIRNNHVYSCAVLDDGELVHTWARVRKE